VKKGFSIDIISETTSLSEDEILKLKEESKWKTICFWLLLVCQFHFS
jgi:hypothetical protein